MGRSQDLCSSSWPLPTVLLPWFDEGTRLLTMQNFLPAASCTFSFASLEMGTNQPHLMTWWNGELVADSIPNFQAQFAVLPHEALVCGPPCEMCFAEEALFLGSCRVCQAAFRSAGPLQSDPSAQRMEGESFFICKEQFLSAHIHEWKLKPEVKTTL